MHETQLYTSVLVDINHHSNVNSVPALCVCSVCSSKPAGLVSSLMHLHVLKYFIHDISMLWINPLGPIDAELHHDKRSCAVQSSTELYAKLPTIIFAA